MTAEQQVPIEKIEILSVELLDQNRELVTALKETARALNLEFGWHYLLDLAWILRELRAHLNDLSARRIMDAGAGTGVLQWYLAQQGAEVFSVDRLSRAALPLRFRGRFHVQGLRETDLLPPRQALRENLARKSDAPLHRRWTGKAMTLAREFWGVLHRPGGPGKIIVYNQDLGSLEDIPSESLDAVVSVSALEHNTQEGLAQVVAEIMRTLKPGGALLATLVAARDQDRWHEASSAWCYTQASLCRAFDLPPALPSNYDRYDELFAALRACAELKDNLASFYFRSGKNGMPWGVWDPQYQPVGVHKIKPRR